MFGLILIMDVLGSSSRSYFKMVLAAAEKGWFDDFDTPNFNMVLAIFYDWNFCALVSSRAGFFSDRSTGKFFLCF
jgi:hypothetical protein